MFIACTTCLLQAPHVYCMHHMFKAVQQPAVFTAVSLFFLNKTGLTAAKCHCNSLPYTGSKDAVWLLGDGNLASNWAIFRTKKIQSASFLKRRPARNSKFLRYITFFPAPNVVTTATVPSVRRVYIRHGAFNFRISAL